jgi:UDP-N-acetylmuramoyl-tripeptide--D-alanyl-D-alanine ligase
MRFLLSEIASATEGTLLGADLEVDGASIDSRAIETGALFVPIVADRDGHEFVDSAMANGAAAHLTTAASSPHPAVAVADTTAALQNMGRLARRRVAGSVIGVTGSVGKTTTKDLMRAALAQSTVVHASHQSFNNELGVPLTLVQAPDDVAVAVTEMGARGVGHIALLCGIAEPDIGVVLNVGGAHTELFGDLDGVARAKGELVEALPAGGTAILNRDDRRVRAMASRTAANVLQFGEAADVAATEVRIDDNLCASFVLNTPWGSARCTLTMAGAHIVPNALAAAAAALSVGAPLEAVVQGLSGATGSPWRMEIHELKSGAVVINDAYNANALSMHAAIDGLVRRPASRRVAVVGVMAELGDRHDSDHREIGERLSAEGIEIIAVGTQDYGGTVVADIAEAEQHLGQLSQGDVVLLKASRVAGLERLAERLRSQ